MARVRHACEATLDHCAHAARDRHAGVERALQSPLGMQEANHLLGEERVPAGAPVEITYEWCADEGVELVGRQATEGDMPDRAAQLANSSGERMITVDFDIAVHANQQHRCAVQI